MKHRLLLLATLSILLLAFRISALKFVAYGDSRSQAGVHQAIVDGFASLKPELVIHSGDLWDGYSPDRWREIITSNPHTDSLLANNLFLVARGNHESKRAVRGFEPAIVRDNDIRYSFTADNCFFVCAGKDPGEDKAWLEQQLQTSAATNADWRIVFTHYPIYSAGSHRESGRPGFEALCDRYNVNAVFSGHDHDYERSYLIYDREVVSKKSDIAYQDSGTVYIVTGGGGAPLREVGSEWWTARSAMAYHYCDVRAGGDTLSIRARTVNGSVFDQVVLRRDPDVSDTAPRDITTLGAPHSVRLSSRAADAEPLSVTPSSRGVIRVHLTQPASSGARLRLLSPAGEVLAQTAVAVDLLGADLRVAELAAGTYVVVLETESSTLSRHITLRR
jgi:predicted phosphodiesterase